MADSDSFLSPYSRKQIFRGIFGKISYFIIKMFCVLFFFFVCFVLFFLFFCLFVFLGGVYIEAILMSTLNVPLLYRRLKRHP